MSLATNTGDPAGFLIQPQYTKALGDFTAAINFFWDGNTSPSSMRMMDKNYATGFILYRQSTTTNLTGGVVVPSAPTGTVSTTINNGVWTTAILRRSGTTISLFQDAAKTDIVGVNTVMSTDQLVIGNAAGSNGWSLRLSRCGIWDTALNDDLCNSFVKGFSPRKFYPASLDMQLSMITNDCAQWKLGSYGGGIFVVDRTSSPRLYSYP